MISRRAFGTALLGSVLVRAPAAAAAPPPAAEGVLRQDLQEARWPADIVRAADRYVVDYPQGPAAAAARAMLDPARRSARALDRNVRLYRGDFLLDGASPAFREEVRKAALADKDAALRVAHMIRDEENGVVFEVNRYVGWLQFATALGNGPASYELAVHYRKTDQPALAAPYELRAEELGFRAPTSLDNIRK
jgi:hypothetical protein